MVISKNAIRTKYLRINHSLDEKTRRLWCATEALSIGVGEVTLVHNWRGVPLISREAVVQLIGSTKTTKGLEIKAQIDYRDYQKGREVDDEDFDGIAITCDKFHGEWNYRISPAVKIGILP